MDANTQALNKYLEEQAIEGKSFEELLDYLDDDFVCVQEKIRAIQKIASDFKSYDFSDDIDEVIKDLI